MLKQRRFTETERRGFFDGSNGIDPQNHLAELGAQYEAKRHEALMRFVPHVQKIAAKHLTAEREKNESQSLARALKSETNGQRPELLRPIGAVLLAAIVTIGEAFWLAPVFEGFGVADVIEQLLLGFVVVAAANVLIHFALKHAQEVGPGFVESRWRRMEHRILCATPVLVLAGFGFWRAQEVMFAAAQGDSPLSQFLAQNPKMTALVISGLTALFPMASAPLFSWGLQRLADAGHWHRANKAARLDARRLDRARAQHQGLEVTKQLQLEYLKKSEEAERHAYLSHYERGVTLGAQQTYRRSEHETFPTR